MNEPNKSTAAVFICHASEDKDGVARPLAEQLVTSGFRVWFDEYSLRLGDSLRTSIDRGLATCRYGIVVLSPAFFTKPWTREELDGLTARELATRRKMILPVWHGLDFAEVAARSPTLAGKLAVTTSRGISYVTQTISSTIRDEELRLGSRHIELLTGFGGGVEMWATPNASGSFGPLADGDFDAAVEHARKALDGILKPRPNDNDRNA